MDLRTRLRRRLVADERRGLRFTLIVTGAFLMFVPVALLAAVVRQRVGFLVDADRSIELSAHHAVLDSTPLLSAARVVTHAGDTLTRVALALVTVAFLAWRRAWRLTLFFLVTFAGGLALADGLKHVIGRARPVLPQPVAHAAGASFPSGHAMGSTVVYGALLLLVAPALGRVARRVVTALAVLLVLAVAASRVLLGVHFLSDVVGGLLLGLAWLAVTIGAFEAWRRDAGERVPDEPMREGLDPAEQRRVTPQA